MGAKTSKEVPANHNFDHDLIVIGAGSGGVPCAKEAGALKASVALVNYVTPTPTGTTWGLGGTCINVGCVPKKLMHQAALLRDYIKDGVSFGWNVTAPKEVNWTTLVDNIQGHIQLLNDEIDESLREANVRVYNQIAEFIDPNTLKMTTPGSDEVKTITGQYILIATGGRPSYLTCPGGRKEDGLCLTSDDIFSLRKPPGKTLVVGAGYIGVETAGFLVSFGFEVTLLVRTEVLRKFDRQISGMVKKNLRDRGVRILKGVFVEEVNESNGGVLLVKLRNGGEVTEEAFQTVILAIGRSPTVPKGVESIGIKVSEASGKIITGPDDRSTLKNIFAIGDVAQDRPELHPIAVQAGKFLGRRLFGGDHDLADYARVPTIVFSPTEYAFLGVNEEEALATYPKGSLQIFQREFTPTEFVLGEERSSTQYFCKMIVHKDKKKDAVVGLHYLGPWAGEVLQGYGLGFRLGATKKDFDLLVGLHPTTAEVFIGLKVDKLASKAGVKASC